VNANAAAYTDEMLKAIRKLVKMETITISHGYVGHNE
jgi:uncharacterized membrane protein